MKPTAFERLLVYCAILIAINTTVIMFRVSSMVNSLSGKNQPSVQQTGFRADIVKVYDRVWVSFEGRGAEGYIVSRPDGGYEFASIDYGMARLPENCKFLNRLQGSDGGVRYEVIRTTEDNL